MEAKEAVYHVSKILKNELQNDSNINKIKEKLLQANELGSIKISYKKCTIEEDWIIEIENKLPYIERAIAEDRHALKKDGNVVRIDQVKKVSVDSIKHLAAHSNLITQIPQNMADIVPSKMYVTENNDNYQLYENRFLYTLLFYLKDFIQSRYTAILSACHQEKKELTIDFDYKTKLSQTKLSLEFLQDGQESLNQTENTSNDELISRIGFLFDSVVSLQNTPLMKMMWDSKLLSLPITATNIIKNNPYFQEAYKLFDFILSYTKPGFEIEEIQKSSSSISFEGRQDISSIIAMLDLISEIEDANKRTQMEKAFLESKLSESDKNVLQEIIELNNKEWQKKLDEKILEKDAQIDAIRARFYDFNPNEHLSEDTFKRLEAEKKAFDNYYEKKWSKVKKTIRKKYFWNQFKAHKQSV